MRLIDFVKSMKETQSQFLARTFWNAPKNVVIVYADDWKKKIVMMMTIDEARVYFEGLKNDLEVIKPNIIIPNEACNCKQRVKCVEETINNPVPDLVYWECNLCGRKFNEEHGVELYGERN